MQKNWISPTILRDFPSPHVTLIRDSSTGKKVFNPNYVHPFTSTYEFNACERLSQMVHGDGVRLEEAFKTIEREIVKWTKETYLTLASVGKYFHNEDSELYEFFKLSLHDMIWFGIQQSPEERRKLDFVVISKVFSTLWRESSPNSLEQYGPMAIPSLPREPPHRTSNVDTAALLSHKNSNTYQRTSDRELSQSVSTSERLRNFS